MMTFIQYSRYPSFQRNVVLSQFSVVCILFCEVFADYTSSYSSHPLVPKPHLFPPDLGIPFQYIFFEFFHNNNNNYSISNNNNNNNNNNITMIIIIIIIIVIILIKFSILIPLLFGLRSNLIY